MMGVAALTAGCAGLEVADPSASADEPAVTAAARIAPATPGGTWTKLTTPVPSAGMMILMTDGTVLVHQPSTTQWWKLTPDAAGSYQTGTWTKIALMPSGYAPLYFGTGVLPDGRLIVEGGEYLSGSAVWTTRGAIYNPVANTWASVAPPAGWTTIGDASGVVLADGTYMQSDCCTTQAALLNPTTLTWTATGTGKLGASNDEESWTRLWDGTILTVDCNNTANLFASELYTPSTGKWTAGPNTVTKTCDLNPDGSGSHENGPQVLRYDGTVLAIGGTGHNDVYSQTTKTWTAAPDSPVVGGAQLDVADGPAVLLPNGNVLIAMSPGVFRNGTHMMEWNGSTFTEVAAPPGAATTTSFQQNFMLLPTGEVLLTAQNSDIEMYKPTVRTPVAAAVPAITALSTTSLTRGTTQTLTGQRLNGLSEAVAYGDDGSGATNYPIVRITSTAVTPNKVFYARTFAHSTRAIGPSVTGSTSFAVPSGLPVGAARIELVANGIPSAAVAVTIL